MEMTIFLEARLDNLEEDTSSNGKCVYLNACELIALALKNLEGLPVKPETLSHFRERYEDFQKKIPLSAKHTRKLGVSLAREIIEHIEFLEALQ